LNVRINRYQLANGSLAEYYSNSLVICEQLRNVDFERIVNTFPDDLFIHICIYIYIYV